MRQVDPLLFKYTRLQDSLIFAASQLQGSRKTQEDYFANYNDECFVLADGVGGMPHGDAAAKLATETAIWGYKLIRQRRYYWADKEKFIQRIFRSTNISLWQKHREIGFEEGLFTTLDLVVLGDRNYWLGHVGDGSCFLLTNNVFKKLTVDDSDKQGYLTKVVGKDRYGLLPQYVSGRFVTGDTLLLATDGVTSVLGQAEIQEALAKAGETSQSLTEVVVELLKKAEVAGSTDNKTAIVIKRIAASV